MESKLIFSNNVADELAHIVDEIKPSDVFVHVDTNTDKFVMPILEATCDIVSKATKIVSAAGDTNKTVDALTKIWQGLGNGGATRKALLINVGGGVVTDMGGFAAATYKRGIKFVNIPTTILGAVDASVGGKTGVNFDGLKNQIGVFALPYATIISTIFFATLTNHEMLSGYGEVVKHAMLKDEKAFNEVLKYDPTLPPRTPEDLLNLLRDSVLVKQSIVEQDLCESGLRKVLNLGHTVGHAFESFAMNDRRIPLAHGFAVAQGLVVESVLSNMIFGFDSTVLHRLAEFVRKTYAPFDITCDDYPRLLEYMHHDKKNQTSTDICFTLLAAIGDPRYDIVAPEKEICAALDIYRDLMGL